jgi:predicted site-specific integrase-resolvase
MSNKQLNAEQVAAMTGLAVSSVLRWIRRGELKAKRTEGYVIQAEDVRSFMLKQPLLSKAGRRKQATVKA